MGTVMLAEKAKRAFDRALIDQEKLSSFAWELTKKELRRSKQRLNGRECRQIKLT